MPVPAPPQALDDGLLPRHTLTAKPLPLAPAAPPSDITRLDPPTPLAASPASPPSPPNMEATVPRTFPVRPFFLLLLCLCLLLAIGTVLALYLPNLKPHTAVPEPTPPPPALVTEDRDSQENPIPSGPIDLIRSLGDQVADRNEEAVNNIQADLANPLASPEPTTAPPDSSDLRALAALAKEVEETRSSQPDPDTPPPSTITHLKNGGTLEKMEDDWLPPGVVRSE